MVIYTSFSVPWANIIMIIPILFHPPFRVCRNGIILVKSASGNEDLLFIKQGSLEEFKAISKHFQFQATANTTLVSIFKSLKITLYVLMYLTPSLQIDGDVFYI